MSQEKEEPKQDAFERAIEIYANEFNGEISKIVKDAIEYYQYLCLLFGDKLQQEQEKNKYSEEDLKEAFKGGGKMSWTDIEQESQEPYYYDFKEWFEQFKK